MKVNIKTSDGELLFYETPGACAFDFKTTEELTFNHLDFKLIETGVVVETPKGYVLQTQPRSSLYKKYNLIQTNSVGIIDQDYCGENDTIKFPLLYLGKKKLVIPKGTRLGQGMFIKIGIADFEVVKKMSKKDRGGFGTTGTK